MCTSFLYLGTLTVDLTSTTIKHGYLYQNLIRLTRMSVDDFQFWLRDNGNFNGFSMHAVLEGRIVHPNVSLTIVQGPLAMAYILEISLLNHLNFQTLIATKASRFYLSRSETLDWRK